jgi:hypothetical protein
MKGNQKACFDLLHPLSPFQQHCILFVVVIIITTTTIIAI